MAVKKRLKQVSRIERPIYVHFGKFITSRLWFEERGIDYTPVKELPKNREVRHLGAGISFYY
jgi:nucleotidyltransferase/DNA polymerase involved in DNA repair